MILESHVLRPNKIAPAQPSGRNLQQAGAGGTRDIGRIRTLGFPESSENAEDPGVERGGTIERVARRQEGASKLGAWYLRQAGEPVLRARTNGAIGVVLMPIDLFGQDQRYSPEPKRSSCYQIFKRNNHYRRAARKSDEKCRHCVHHKINSSFDRPYHKCEMMGISSSVASDILVKNVCDKFEAAPHD